MRVSIDREIELTFLSESMSKGVMLPLGDLAVSGHIEPLGLRSKSMLAILPRGLLELETSGTSECLGLLLIPAVTFQFAH